MKFFHSHQLMCDFVNPHLPPFLNPRDSGIVGMKSRTNTITSFDSPNLTDLHWFKNHSKLRQFCQKPAFFNDSLIPIGDITQFGFHNGFLVHLRLLKIGKVGKQRRVMHKHRSPHCARPANADEHTLAAFRQINHSAA